MDKLADQVHNQRFEPEPPEIQRGCRVAIFYLAGKEIEYILESDFPDSESFSREVRNTFYRYWDTGVYASFQIYANEDILYSLYTNYSGSGADPAH